MTKKHKTVHRLRLLAALFLSSLSLHATIAYDADTGATDTDGDPISFTHTPSGTPKAVLVFVEILGSTSDVISACTYGGVGMTKVATATDTSGEAGYAAGFFLGASIPTGAQTVNCTIDSGTPLARAWAVTATAAADTELAGTTGFCTVSEDADNPSCTVTGIAGASWGASGLYYGGLTASATAGSGFTKGDGVSGASSSANGEYLTTESGSGDLTIAWTYGLGTDDTAMVGIAIQEVSASSRRFMSVD